MTWSRLPSQVYQQVFQNIPDRDYLSARQVCRSWCTPVTEGMIFVARTSLENLDCTLSKLRNWEQQDRAHFSDVSVRVETGCFEFMRADEDQLQLTIETQSFQYGESPGNIRFEVLLYLNANDDITTAVEVASRTFARQLMLQEDVKLHVIPFACQAQPVLPYVLENVLETPMTAHKRRIFVDRLHTDIPAARPSQQRLPHASSRRMQRVVKRIFLPALVLLMVRPLYKQQRQKHTLQA